jgi:hypothetical protein
MPIELKSKQKDAPASDKPKKRKAAVRGRVPNKQSINLAMVGVKKTNWALVILVLVLIFVALGAAGKFLILDRLAEVRAAEAEADEVLTQINMVNMKIQQYGEMNDIYAHYTYTGMTEEERTRVERTEVMNLLQRTVILRTDVSKWDLSGNLLTVTVTGDTLEDINMTAQKLRDDPFVNYCQVNTAKTNTVTKYAYELDTAERVAAVIVAYLNRPEEVAEK